jgi:hypothetical protein
MATAAVAQPVPALVAQSFDQASVFVVTSKVDVPKTGNEDDGIPEDVLATKFILNDQCFVDLQIYLKSAMRIPNSNNAFESAFLESDLKEYMTKDNQSPPLYAVCTFD